ncbi:hypothetical protein ABID95_004773 [Streptomyces atratus]
MTLPALALALDVGLADRIVLTRGSHDLDNYLFPLTRTFRASRFDAVLARKRHAASSTIAIGPAMPADPDRAEVPPLLSVLTSVSATSAEWKEAIHQACRAAKPEPDPDGPLQLKLCFRLSAGRNWSTLWKPAIDALGPLLGMPDPGRPYRPNDDRIVDLADPDHSRAGDPTRAERGAVCTGQRGVTAVPPADEDSAGELLPEEARLVRDE